MCVDHTFVWAPYTLGPKQSSNSIMMVIHMCRPHHCQGACTPPHVQPASQPAEPREPSSQLLPGLAFLIMSHRLHSTGLALGSSIMSHKLHSTGLALGSSMEGGSTMMELGGRAGWRSRLEGQAGGAGWRGRLEGQAGGQVGGVG